MTKNTDTTKRARDSKPMRKDKKKNTKKEMKRRKSISSSDSESDSEWIKHFIGGDSEYDEDDDSDYVDEESEEETGEESEEEESEEEESEDGEKKKRKMKKQKKKVSSSKKKATIDHTAVQEIISKLMPSKYMSEKVKKNKKKSTKKKKKNDEDESDEEEYDEEESSEEEYDEEESSEEENDEEESSEEDDEEDEEENEIILLLGGGGGNESYNSKDDKYDCNSDDEETFMKENYQKIELPEQFEKDRKTSKKKSSIKPKDKDEEQSDDEDDNVEKEYLELRELKKDFTEKLKKCPKNKYLPKAIADCDDQIKKLVKENRIKNTRKYHKLINNSDKRANEVDYFKTKMSHNEQRQVLKEMKRINQYINIDKPYRISLLTSTIPPQFKAIALQKLNVLKTMEPGDPEYYKLKHWVDAFMRIPFNKYKSLEITLDAGKEKCQEYMLSAKNTLDMCAYGLNDAKMQIMQMMGQWISNPNSMGTAIAIKGPMGTGKTTLVKEGISKIMNREFAFIALGGNSDASFLEGHSYTYEGSNWGKIVQILMECKSMNPIIYFDELDKVSDTPKGEEIIGILTHLTDTSQNSEYHDKYFSDISFDLSKCLFIFSYNDESKVNPILRDRMYRIQTKGYDMKEKMIIAKDYLMPKIREQVNMTAEEVIIPDETLQYIISNEALTFKEDGVRNLKRCLEIIHTKLNLYRLVDSDNKMFEEMKMKVEFPFTVTNEYVDTMIKHNDRMNPSLFGLYI